MKIFFYLFSSALLLSSCFAYHSGLTSNLNNHTTEVVLSKKNFKVIQSVQGECEALYILGIGGLKKQGMIAEARTKMLVNAKLIGTSRAIINETVEMKYSFFPLVRKQKVIVSANIIEFTD